MYLTSISSNWTIWSLFISVHTPLELAAASTSNVLNSPSLIFRLRQTDGTTVAFQCVVGTTAASTSRCGFSAAPTPNFRAWCEMLCCSLYSKEISSDWTRREGISEEGEARTRTSWFLSIGCKKIHVSLENSIWTGIHFHCDRPLEERRAGTGRTTA